jgi:hypothetical protein
MTSIDSSAAPRSRKTLYGLLAAIVLLVAGFYYLEGRYNLSYELSVRRKMPHGDKAEFSGVQHFKSGAICGNVKSADGTQRFIVTREQSALLEDIKPGAAAVFEPLRVAHCRD